MKGLRKKRALTLLEVMVVIFIIGIIGAVLGVNMKGSLEEGKAFKSEAGSKQVYEVLNLEIAKDDSVTTSIADPKKLANVLKKSPFVQSPEKLLVDGWGEQYEVNYDQDQDRLFVTSKKLIKYFLNKKKLSERKIIAQCPWIDPSTIALLKAGAPKDTTKTEDDASTTNG